MTIEYPAADVIIVPGAQPLADGSPSPALCRRIIQAVELYHHGASSRLLLCGGDHRRHLHTEAQQMAEIALREGVDGADIWQETQSRTTFENAHYGKAIIRRQGWHTAWLVSDSWHLYRARLVFSGSWLTMIRSQPCATAALPERLTGWGRELLAIPYYHWRLRRV